ncbi:8839_t:CDS:2, partial [Racocetra fulgida]
HSNTIKQYPPKLNTDSHQKVRILSQNSLARNNLFQTINKMNFQIERRIDAPDRSSTSSSVRAAEPYQNTDDSQRSILNLVAEPYQNTDD